MNTGTFGNRAETICAVKSANIESSADSCTMRRGASPAEGTEWAPARDAADGGMRMGAVEDGLVMPRESSRFLAVSSYEREADP